MPTAADQIKTILDQTQEGVPVIFRGVPIRQIGTVPAAPSAAAVKSAVDAMLLSQRLAAEKISVATLVNDSRRFVIAHG